MVAVALVMQLSVDVAALVVRSLQVLAEPVACDDVSRGEVV